MKIISEANESVLTMLRLFYINEERTRWSQHCVITPAIDGMLVFNLLTRELIFLDQVEFERFDKLDYLKRHWFVVPVNLKEKDLADFVKLRLYTQQPKSNRIVDYTIFTTTDCNARCFYCFELGRSRIPMSCETAEKVVRYIGAHCGGKEVRIGWFGGEPLFNVEAIDSITEGLHREGIKFTSRMVSNGYLFDDGIVHRAVSSWNLKTVQITLDGTERIYNKIKAYIYPDSNPFDVVMDNILRLQQAGIRVSIRLNMDLYNADDLLVLVDYLAARFAGRKGISVYAHHLFKGNTPNAELHTMDDWNKRQEAMDRLNDALERNALLPNKGISKNFRLSYCMADSGKAVTILPDGSIGLCEHCTEGEFIGHLDRNDIDTDVVASWEERTPEIAECSNCFFYMDCIKLKKCFTGSTCYPQFHKGKLKEIQRAMRYEYERWRSKTNTAEDEDDSFC